MIRRLKRYLFLFPILIVQVAYAQNYPVRVTPILSPPYTPFLTDYIEAAVVLVECGQVVLGDKVGTLVS